MRLFALTILVTLACGILYVARNDLRNLVLPSAPAESSRPASAAEEPPKVFASGVVEGLQSPLVLKFETPGKVHTIRVRAGESVKAGQILAELEPESYELKASRAEAQLQIATAERDQLTSGRRSAGNPAQPRRPNQGEQELPQRPMSNPPNASKETLAIADAHVAAAESALKLELLLLEKTRLVAPVDGTVLSVPLQKGDLVGPSTESASITMINRSKTRVRAFVEELDAMNVAVGQKATVVASGRSDRNYAGVILACAPFVQPKTHRHLNPGERIDVRVREIIIELKDAGDLLTGLPVEVFVDLKLPVNQGDHISQSVPRSKAASRKPLAH